MTNTTIPELTSLKKSDLPAAFIDWVAGQETNAAAEWAKTLAPKQQAQMTQEIANFCHDAGFDLSWVVQDQIDDETLQIGLVSTVLKKFIALHEAASVQSRLELHKATIAWLSKLTSRKYRQQTRAIYSRLANDGTIAPASAEALLDSDKNRWAHVTAAIHASYAEHPEAVRAAVGEYISTGSSKSNDERQTTRFSLPFRRQTSAAPA